MMNKYFAFAAALAVAFMVTGVAVGGPVGYMPMTGADTQNTSMFLSGTTYDILPYPMWTVNIPDGVWSTPLIDADDNIYVTSNGAKTYIALDSDGNELWSVGTSESWGTDGQGCLGAVGENVYWYVPFRYDDDTGEVWKLDTADGSLIWTVNIPTRGGIPPQLNAVRMKIDADGDLYLVTVDSGYAYKITDNGASGSIVWESYTGHIGWAAELAMNSAEDRVYVATRYAAVTPADRQKLIALNASTGATVWATTWGDQSTVPCFDWIGSFPVVDDAGGIYIYIDNDENVGVPNFQGIHKYNSSGVLQWSRPVAWGWYNTWCVGQNGLSFNPDQTRIYNFGRGTVWSGWVHALAIDTTTGYVQWSHESALGGGTSGACTLIGPNGKIYLGGLNWGDTDVACFTDNGTYGTHDWDSTTGMQGSYNGGISIDSEGYLYAPSTTAGGGLSKLYFDGPPLAIILPPTLGPFEEEIPIYGLGGTGFPVYVKGATGTVTFDVFSGAFPPGVYITSDGRVCGLPDKGSSAGGPYTVTIRATDDIASATKTYVIEVVMAALQLGPGAPLGVVGSPYGCSGCHGSDGLWILGGTGVYTVTITPGKGDYVSGGQLGWTTGLTLNSDGTITGTPTAISSATVEVTINDGNDTITADITIDVVDNRVWDTFQRTTRRVGTSMLPAPLSYPHNMGNYDPGDTSKGRTFQYNSADTWTWTYEMMHAPLFAMCENDADEDGFDDGYMFMYDRFWASPDWGTPWNQTLRVAAPYDVDPGGIYPDATAFGGWWYSPSLDGIPGNPAQDVGVLSLKAKGDDVNTLYADKWFWSNDMQGGDARLACMDACDGTLCWSLRGDPQHVWPDEKRSGFRGIMALLENGDLVDVIGSDQVYYFEPIGAVPGAWDTTAITAWYKTGYDHWVRTYGIIRYIPCTRGEVIWTAGEDNTMARAGMGPLFGNLGKPYHGLAGADYRGSLSIFKLADEGELVLAQRGGPNPYYVAGRWVIRADKPGSHVVWTIGQQGLNFTGWTWEAASARACPVVDSTNNIYITKDRRLDQGGPSANYPPGIWAIDAAFAADNVDVASGDQWFNINSDSAIKWFVPLADAEYRRIPATPCLSCNQRTLYTVAVARAVVDSDTYGHSQPVHLHPGTKCQLIAIHTLNGVVKWVKDLEIDGLSGCDLVERDEAYRPAFAPMADPDGKVLCYTAGDRRQWWLTPGAAENEQGPEFAGLLRPMAWCFKDTCSSATLLWTRAMSQQQYLDWGGPGSYAVTPNYRLLFAGNLDPEWIVPGRLDGWGAGNPYYMTGVHIIHPDDIHITDVLWSQQATSVVLTFTTQTGVQYTVETADADEYDDSVTWSDLTTVTATGDETTVSDNLTTNALTHDMRFYRVRRTESDPFYSDEVAAVFELDMQAGPLSPVYFIGTPLVPDPDHKSVREVFGEGANRQIPRTGLRVTDLDEATGSLSAMEYNFAGTFDVIAGSEFDFVEGTGYEVVMGFGPPTLYTLRLTGFVSEQDLAVAVTKAGTQSLRWFAYSLPRPIALNDLGLENAVTPWIGLNQVRLLPLGSNAWSAYQYNGTYWYDISNPGTPVNPTIEAGMGIVFIRFGPPDATDVLIEATWYFHPPNAW